MDLNLEGGKDLGLERGKKRRRNRSKFSINAPSTLLFRAPGTRQTVRYSTMFRRGERARAGMEAINANQEAISRSEFEISC